MKRTLTTTATLLLLLGYSNLLIAQQSSNKPSLQLTTEVINQSFCMIDAKTDAMQLRLRLSYRNTGDQKIILYKGHKLFYETRISRNREDLAARRYEVDTSMALYFDGFPEKIDRPAPSSEFVILSPGTVHESETLLNIPVKRDPVANNQGAISEGGHVLQLTVSTWYESKSLAEELRGRWQRKGFLWWDRIRSEAMDFVVGKERPTSSCASGNL